ncbi:MAG: S4 domain-containing protein [bacterium]
MRIDKYLASLGLVSRRDAKKIFKENIITVNDEEVFDNGHILHE